MNAQYWRDRPHKRRPRLDERDPDTDVELIYEWEAHEQILHNLMDERGSENEK